tara:strand:+ start:89 stop:502 length:414 start_codon:yes stop_codon:yes gene_type:complete
MAGEQTLDVTQYPDIFGYFTTTISSTNITSDDGDAIIFIADQDIVVDSITFMFDEDDAANFNIKVTKSPSGTVPGSGTDICTAITDTVGAYTSISGVVSTTENHVPAGNYLALAFTDTVSASVDIIHVTVRYRTRLR